MRQYFIRRVLLAVPTFIGVTIVIFVAVRFLPGDVVDQMIGDFGAASPETRERIKEAYALDSNIAVQYLEWLGDLAQGDFGTSIISGRPVGSELRTRLEPTLEMGIIGMVSSVAVALPLGVISATRQATWIDYVGRSIAILFLAVPAFWLGLLIIVYGWVFFGWTPPIAYESLWSDPAANLGIILPPGLILGVNLGAITMRMARSTMLEVMREDYVRTAMAKGLRERKVIIGHALRNALIPVVTIIGTQVPIVIGGVVVLERVFSIPGLGNYLLSSLSSRDYPIVQAIVLVTSVAVIVTNLVVDMSYSLLDPRIRYG